MRILRNFAATAAAAVVATAATAADYTLTISSWTPPTHGINAMMWPNLIKMMEEATDGRVTGEVKLGLAPPPAQMDLVLDRAADMTIIFHGYQAGRFVATKLIELPGYEGNAEAASVAYWRVYDKHLKEADEHRGVKVVAMHTHGPAHLHSNVPVDSLDDISGLKLRVPGGVGGDVGAALGATGIKVPAPKVYETLASKAADGVVMPLEGRKGFKLTEVAPHLYMIPGGLYRGSFAILMNQEVWDEMPDDIKQALEENVFGEPASRMLGQVWDEIDAIGLEETKTAEGNTITEASDADMEAYGPIADKIIADTLAEIEALGIDAKAAHEMVKQEMAAESGS